MKKVEVVKSSQVNVRPFILQSFIQPKEMPATIIKKVTKKELMNLADSLAITYEDVQISFSKKLLNAYLKQMSNK